MKLFFFRNCTLSHIAYIFFNIFIGSKETNNDIFGWNVDILTLKTVHCFRITLILNKYADLIILNNLGNRITFCSFGAVKFVNYEINIF